MKFDFELAQLIIEHLEGAAITDSEGRYIYVSKDWVKKIGKQPDEVLGKYSKDVIPDTKIHVALRTRKPQIGEIFHHSGSQKEPTAFVTYIPIMKDSEVVAGFLFSLFSDIDVVLSIKHKLESVTHELEYYKEELRKIRGSRYTVEHIIGNSKAVSLLKEQIYQAARSNSTVLIEGETGTGKELVAHAIHNASRSNSFNFIKINCAAIPGELLESEFFGYEEGSFSGAKKGGRPGKFEMANHGSLFLDEVNQMPLVLQPKLLRVLQEKEIERIGNHKSIPVDVRVIAATNAPLEKLVKEKKFRTDLFYRLNVIKINVPPLRERKEDIPVLVESLIKKLNFQLGVKVNAVSPEVINVLMNYDWPGNIRELQNVLERAMNMAWGDVLEVSHLSGFLDNEGLTTNSSGGSPASAGSLKEKKKFTEKEAIKEALQICQGNRVLAARLLNISRNTLYKKLRKYDP